MKKGFSLVELLVGLMITLFLASAILVFLTTSNYGFQIHRDLIKDRNELKHSLILSGHLWD